MEGIFCDKMGRNALHNAAIENDTELVRRLIYGKLDINAKDKTGFTALHFAAQNGCLETATILIKNGANINSIDIHGNTPLAKAVFEYKNGPGEIIQLLKENGADPMIKNKYGASALSTARLIANYDVKRFFTEYE